MNGRIYDPVLGRFLSADPFVQATENYQNYNRYSYVLNNPLSYTDPSGHNPFAIFFAFLFAAEVIGPELFLIATFATTLGFNLIMGASFGEALKGAVIATAAAYVANQIGGLFADNGALAEVFADASKQFVALAKASLHGLNNGVFSELGGGDFGSGFFSGFVSSLGNGFIDSRFGDNLLAGTIAAGIVGGTASVIGGGKFTNGAYTGALMYLINDKRHKFPKTKEEVEIKILPSNEANKLIAEGYPVELTGVAHNKGESARIVWAMDENKAAIFKVLHPGYTAIGIDGFFDPQVYHDSGGKFVYFKITQGLEIDYVGATVSYKLDKNGVAVPFILDDGVRNGIKNSRAAHFWGYLDRQVDINSITRERHGTGWKTKIVWPAAEKALREKGLME